MEYQSRLIIVAGLPGSGKTTRARQLEQQYAAVRLSADDWLESLGFNLHAEQERDRVEKLQWQLAQRLLTLKNTVIVEWGTWSRCERDILRVRARELGAGVELHFLAAPPEELFQRIQLRARETPPVELDAVNRWGGIIEVPTDEEIALFDPHL